MSLELNCGFSIARKFTIRALLLFAGGCGPQNNDPLVVSSHRVEGDSDLDLDYGLGRDLEFDVRSSDVIVQTVGTFASIHDEHRVRVPQMAVKPGGSVKVYGFNCGETWKLTKLAHHHAHFVVDGDYYGCIATIFGLPHSHRRFTVVICGCDPPTTSNPTDRRPSVEPLTAR